MTNLYKETTANQAERLNLACWLVKNLNYNPYKRCQHCNFKFRNCLFLHYQVISGALITFTLLMYFIFEGKVPTIAIITVFTSVMVYGYYFNKSTEKIVEANFAQIKANTALEELTQNLAAKVEEQTKDITKQTEHLQKLLNIRSEFLDITSHQLRTPVTVIKGVLSMLKNGSVPKEKIGEFIDTAFIKSLKLGEIINDILRASEMDSEQFTMHIQPTDLNAILEKVRSDKVKSLLNKDVELKFSPCKKALPLVLTDERYIEQAIVNLINNAIQYTLKGSITVSTECLGDRVVIRVADTGIGIPESERDKLFHKFGRAENAVKTFTDGSGLGLFIIKQVVDANPGAKIEIEKTEVGKGTTFALTLPVAKDQKEKAK